MSISSPSIFKPPRDYGSANSTFGGPLSSFWKIRTSLQSKNRRSGLVYKVRIEDPDNVWNLPEDDYAFKVQIKEEKTACYEAEIAALVSCPYENVAKLVGYGKFQGSFEQQFIVLKWEEGGDLETKIDDLTWDQAKKVLKTLAYGLHMLHTTGKTVVMDLKPANVLLHESYSSIICDLGSTIGAGSYTGSDFGTTAYNDSSSFATPARDVFSYGVTLFQMLTDQFDINTNGKLFTEKMQTLIEEEKNLEVLVKKRLKDTGCSQEMSRKVILLGATCISADEKARPSVLQIYKALRDIGI